MIVRLFFLVALLASGTASAQSVSQQPHTRVELVSETRAPRPGQRVTLAVSMTAKPGWHTYWQNPGDAGIETRATWQLPPGARAGAFRYPVPQPYAVGGIMNHVFEGEAVLLVDIAVPEGASGAFPIRLRLDWLVCDESLCIPESAELSLPLSIGDGTPDPAVASRFAAARAALPQPLEEVGTFQLADGLFRLKAPVPAEGIRTAHFFPLRHDLLAQSAPQRLGADDGALVIETQAAANPGARESLAQGVLRVERADGSVLGFDLNLIEGRVPPGRPLDPAPKPAAGTAFWSALGLAILGGLLLNLMPCVFPILSLKAMSLAKAGTSAAAARTEGLAYTAGVLLSCVALGAIAIALARAGEGAGWAFQLQDPRVILFLLLLILAIGLNFAGLFEVNLGSANVGQGLAARSGPQGAFFTGALAAFVATPCTGPFMAGALGAALVLPPAAGLAVFAGLGLGLALPFLAVGLVPALRRRMPRPGPWMLGFRRILAIPMLLTAVALAWVLGRQAGVDGVAYGLLAALMLGLALWWVGLRQGRMGGAQAPAALALVAAVAGPVLLPQVAPGAAPAAAAPEAGMKAGGVKAAGATAFSPEALAEARASGRPVFLYFTADWCITCKVNERGALASPEVTEALEAAGATVMVGDWTRPDPAIARFLAERGRAGVPLYLVFGPDGEAQELPQILTADAIVSALKGRNG